MFLIQLLIFFLAFFVNAIHYLFKRRIGATRLFYISGLVGIQRYILIGWCVVIALANIINIFIWKEGYILLEVGDLYWLYMNIIAIILRIKRTP